MFSYDDILIVFYNKHLFTKEDLVDYFKLEIELIEEDEKLTPESRRQKLILYNRFLSKLNKCRLPKLEPADLEYYDCEITAHCIELVICKAGSDMELTEDGQDIDSLSSTIENTLLSAESDYVTVEQFAKIQEVTSMTVRNWIRKGRLRYAKLADNGEWLIPSTEDKPSRYYGFVEYSILEPLQIEEFPLVSLSEIISIHRDPDDRSVYKCWFRNFTNQYWRIMELTQKDVEELEYVLIASGKTKAIPTIRQVPSFERAE